jgi:RNA polymerase sigma-70 factor (ECF subfamily)
LLSDNPVQHVAPGRHEYSPITGVFSLRNVMDERAGVRGGLTTDERALLDRLLTELGPRILAYVRRTYGGQQDAEDIGAETFFRAAKNVTAVRASVRQDLYLLTIARNLCRDRFRCARHGPLPEDYLQGQPDAVLEPHENIARAEQLAAVRAAVAALPENLREVVVLRLSTGLRFEELAELLKVPLGTALSRMHAAVQRLRETLGCVHEH